MPLGTCHIVGARAHDALEGAQVGQLETENCRGGIHLYGAVLGVARQFFQGAQLAGLQGQHGDGRLLQVLRIAGFEPGNPLLQQADLQFVLPGPGRGGDAHLYVALAPGCQRCRQGGAPPGVGVVAAILVDPVVGEENPLGVVAGYGLGGVVAQLHIQQQALAGAHFRERVAQHDMDLLPIRIGQGDKYRLWLRTAGDRHLVSRVNACSVW